MIKCNLSFALTISDQRTVVTLAENKREQAFTVKVITNPKAWVICLVFETVM